MNMATAENLAPTLLAEQSLEIVVYENHAQDCRYGDVGDTAPTVTSRYGTGGGQHTSDCEINRKRSDGQYGL